MDFDFLFFLIFIGIVAIILIYALKKKTEGKGTHISKDGALNYLKRNVEGHIVLTYSHRETGEEQVFRIIIRDSESLEKEINKAPKGYKLIHYKESHEQYYPWL